MSVGYRFPLKSVLMSTGPTESKADLLPAARALYGTGVKFYATAGTAKFLRENALRVFKLDGS